MNSSSIPDRTGTVFASGGNYNDIAESSSTTTLAAGTVTYESGFPPLTMTAISSGGIAPAGKDMNGILKDISQKLQWADAGCGYPFDATFASSIGGYPKGATVPASDYSGVWLNTTNANATSPEGTAATSTGWVPLSFAGTTVISGLSATSLTMSCLQAANKTLILSGTLTSNIYLYFPTWKYAWRVINNCTGNYSVILKTPKGSASISVCSGVSIDVYCDGSNIINSFAVSYGDSGYEVSPSGIIHQWGVVAISGSGARSVVVTFPESFKQSCYQVVVSDTGHNSYSYGASELSTDSFTIYVPNYFLSSSGTAASTSTCNVRYMAIGK